MDWKGSQAVHLRYAPVHTTSRITRHNHASPTKSRNAPMPMKSAIDAGTTLERTFRNAGSRDHGHHKLAKRSLAWRERSEGKKVPAFR